MGYSMATAGLLVLPAEQEPRALDAARGAMAPLQGWFDGDADLGTLDDLARYVGAAVTRDGERLLLATDEDGDPKWSDQATAFYLAIAPFVSAGEVRFVGEDERSWQYRYEDGALRQDGINGWDGSNEPFGPPADLMTDPAEDLPPAPVAPPSRRPRREEQESASVPTTQTNSLGLSPTVVGLLIGLTVLVILVLSI
ncbi:OprD family porin [Nocardioides panacisoli]|uniref:OprD family porin n=1 Tax=Nocardioides panacisoli TaxID=627624 RepID=UPI001C62C044|nr:OprD family porin [Nocardioides panacisoli]QYJ03873.1 OprD family porin [Nocardioides panacisoli]